MTITNAERFVSTRTVSPTEVHGAVRVPQRVIEKVIREATASLLGVQRKDLVIDIADWGGGLVIKVETKLRIPDLGDTQTVRTQGSIIDQLRSHQTELVSRCSTLTGKNIRRISFEISGAVVTRRKRVR